MKDWLFLILGVAIIMTLVVLWATPHAHAAGWRQCGTASFYGEESGRVTASGARFNPEAMTAAMWGPAFGARYRVTYRGKSVVVTITDRGPAKRLHRLIDLSRGAARRIGLTGVGRVCIERL